MSNTSSFESGKLNGKIEELSDQVGALNAKQVKYNRGTSAGVSVPSNYNSSRTNTFVSITTALKTADIHLIGLWVDYISPAGWMFLGAPRIETDANGYLKIASQVINYYSSELTCTVGFGYSYIDA